MIALNTTIFSDEFGSTITLKMEVKMKTYSYSGKECFEHVFATTKMEAIKSLRNKGEKANKNNVRLLHKGMW